MNNATETIVIVIKFLTYLISNPDLLVFDDQF